MFKISKNLSLFVISQVVEFVPKLSINKGYFDSWDSKSGLRLQRGCYHSGISGIFGKLVII